MGDFEEVWARIRRHAGEEFRTVTGLPFTYRVESGHVVPDRTDYPLHAGNFRKAWDLMPLAGPGQLSRMVRGPSYVYALLADPRIRG